MLLLLLLLLLPDKHIITFPSNESKNCILHLWLQVQFEIIGYDHLYKM